MQGLRFRFRFWIWRLRCRCKQAWLASFRVWELDGGGAGNIGIMGYMLGLYRDNGKEHGNYRDDIGLI